MIRKKTTGKLIDSKSFESNFVDFINEHSLIKRDDSVIVSYSGGVDSSVLLHLLNMAVDVFNYKLTICYFNHNLRGDESIEEEKFIKRIAGKYALQIETGSADITSTAKRRSISIQESARYHRYDFLDKISKKLKANKIATAHHYDDQAETVLMNFLRGSSFKGMRGIPLVRDKYIRPLIWAERREIEEYLSINKIRYFEDSSNRKSDYTRNKIRNEIIPFLNDKLGTNINRILVNQGKLFNDTYSVLQEITIDAYNSSVLFAGENKIVLDITAFRGYFSNVQKYVICECLKRLGEPDSNLIRKYAKKVVDNFLGTKKRKYLYITNELMVGIEDKSITFCRTTKQKFEHPVTIGKRYSFTNEKFQIYSQVITLEDDNKKGITALKKNMWDEVVDSNSIVGSLKVRNWEVGDRFIPLGMRNRKKLSDYFIDLKVPIYAKNIQPILVDSEKIVWICGSRIDDRVKVTKGTKQVLGLKFSNLR